MSYVSIIAFVLILLNTYPVLLSRDLVFREKQSSLAARANQISISIGTLDSITQMTVSGVMKLTDTTSLGRVTVVNSDRDVLYQEIDRSSMSYELDPKPLIDDALSGSDSFSSRFSGGSFMSCAAVPIISNGKIAGSVYIYEYDDEVGTIILNLQTDIRIASIFLAVITIIAGLIYSGTFTKRITKVLDAIENVREGEYSYRINLEGHDELTGLAEEFNSLTTRLQSTEETRRRFVADASHDLKTPLASIRLLSDSILQTENMDNETLIEFVGDIRNESERLAKTTAQLLELTKLDNNTATVRDPINVAEVTANVIRMLHPIAEAKNISLSSNVDGDIVVLSSEDDLFQIISNLMENAIKYTDEGGSVSILGEKRDEKAVLTVSDNGIGIPEQDLPYIFDRFYRVDKSRNREQGGSGLGLSIVKSTVEKHGGTVEARGNEAGGMDFIVTFPLYS